MTYIEYRLGYKKRFTQKLKLPMELVTYFQQGIDALCYRQPECEACKTYDTLSELVIIVGAKSDYNSLSLITLNVTFFYCRYIPNTYLSFKFTKIIEIIIIKHVF